MKRYRSTCAMVGCRHNGKTCPSRSFYRYPHASESERLKLWITLTGKERLRSRKRDGTFWKPARTSRVCACHFAEGQKCNDPTSPIGEDHSKIMAEIKESKVEKICFRTPFGTTLMPLAYDDHNYIKCQGKYDWDDSVHVGTQVNFPAKGTCKCFDGEKRTHVLLMVCCIDDENVGIQTSFDPGHCVKSTCTARNDQTGSTNCSLEVKSVGFVGFNHMGATEDVIDNFACVTSDLFYFLLSLLSTNPSGLSAESCLLLFLTKLRYGLPFAVLGSMFSVTEMTASEMFKTMLITLSTTTHSWIVWPSAARVQWRLPPCFAKYPKCKCILECFDIKTEKPQLAHTQAMMFSHTKGTYTCKVLIGVSPDGLISFLSKAFNGGTSVRNITTESRILDAMKAGDMVFAEEGFSEEIVDLTAGRVEVVAMPSFSVSEPEKDDYDYDYKMTRCGMSSVHLHVEEALRRIRKFDILNVTLPRDLLPHVDNIVHICAVLANLQPFSMQG